MAHPPGAGKSSFDLCDLPALFSALDIEGRNITVADLGCGAGNYTLALARHLGPAAVVHAVDLWPEGIEQLKQQAAADRRVRPILADLAAELPIADDGVDLCLMATVLHDLVHAGRHEPALEQIGRILAPQGRFAVVEFNKQPGPPGPPEAIRLSPDQTDALLAPWGFCPAGHSDLGDHLYLGLYRRPAGRCG